MGNAADRSPVEVDEPGCVPVENALLEFSDMGKLVLIKNFKSWQRKSMLKTARFFFLPVIKGHNLLIIIVNAEVRVVIHEKERKSDLNVTNTDQLCLPPFYS